jgi:NACalpha-BTF3-like transcription factor
MKNSEQVRSMRKLGMTEEEIANVLECDARIDKGEKLFEQDEAQKQTSKEMRQATAVDAYGKKRTRERKANADKREIIQCLDDALCCLVDDVKIVNPEREIEFIYNDIRYKIVLSAPRK